MERKRPGALKDLLSRFLADADEEAIEELVRRTQPRLLATARRIAGPSAAEDAVQTAYHSLLRKSEVPQAPLMAWLVTAVVRTAYRHRAKQKREYDVARRLTQEARTPETGDGGEPALLRHEIDRLPAAYRDAVVLHYLEGLTAAEAGRLLGVSEAAVWQRLRRARALLKSRLSPRLKYGLLVVPWWLADTAAAVPVLGGLMKGKAALIGASALLALCVGVALKVMPQEKPRDRVSRDAANKAPGPADEARIDDAEAPAPASGKGADPEQPAKPGPTPGEVRLTDHLSQATATAVRVEVIDDRKAPWSGARVWLTRLERAAVKDPIKRKTAADGIVEFAGSSPGDWLLSVMAGGIHKFAKLELVCGRKLEVTAMIPRTGATVEGVVRHKEAGPLANVSVSLRASEALFSTHLSATTDEGGRYRIPIIPMGTYQVTIAGKQLADQPRQYEDLVVTKPGAIRLDLLVVNLVSLSGVVRNANTHRPIPDVTVVLQEPVRRRCETDAEGNYRFFDLPSGEAELAAHTEGFGREFFVIGAIKAGEALIRDIALHPAATLHLHLTDAEGRPADGKAWLYMVCHEKAAATLSSSMLMDSDGHAVYRMIRPGRYDLCMRQGTARSLTREFEIHAGQNTIHFQLPPPGYKPPPMLAGKVVDAKTSQPLAGVRVHGTSFGASSVTDALGEFRFARLAEAEQVLLVSKDDYGFRKVRTAKLQKGRTQQIEIRLDPAATLKLSIRNAKGEPPTEPVFLIFRRKGAPREESWNAPIEVDEEGEAAYRSVPPGKYQVIVVSKEGSAAVEVDVPVEGASVEVRLR